MSPTLRHSIAILSCLISKKAESSPETSIQLIQSVISYTKFIRTPSYYALIQDFRISSFNHWTMLIRIMGKPRQDYEHKKIHWSPFHCCYERQIIEKRSSNSFVCSSFRLLPLQAGSSIAESKIKSSSMTTINKCKTQRLHTIEKRKPERK